MASQFPTPKPPITWVFANEAARLAAGGFAPADVGLWALQLLDATVWRLTDDAPPTWAEEPNGPRINKLRTLKPDWPSFVLKTMKDGGANTSVSNPNPIRRWELVYKKVGKTGSDWLQMVDDHFEECLGFADGFAFRHPKTLVLYNDVHYEVFEDPDHTNKVEQQLRRLTLIKRPPA